ncbi:hypothetical protein SD77_1593 [Bacillus badius]|uniref:Uncharacterized protein n=1 Tax=Bacillus badius TaxID=1455 RepID=A0ABR5ARH3_BACBA|nr:hypothetical protein SD78_4353 [Bacillus badius]KIL77350.1 hypothetical protein SD77_1593 [Bacillus badius]
MRSLAFQRSFFMPYLAGILFCRDQAAGQLPLFLAHGALFFHQKEV